MSQSFSAGVRGVASWDLVEEGMVVQERVVLSRGGVFGDLVCCQGRWGGKLR